MCVCACCACSFTRMSRRLCGCMSIMGSIEEVGVCGMRMDCINCVS